MKQNEKEQKKKDLLLWGILAAVVWVLTRPQKVVRYQEIPGGYTVNQLAENYKEMISGPFRVYINPTNPDEPDTGVSWAVFLAGFTKNYESVKAAYKKFYGGDLSTDLIAWFRPTELSEYVAALWENKQAMS